MIEIDGSQGEGGGQILRSSLTLSLVTGKPVRLTNIRAGRDKPGLMRQHLTAVRAAAEVGRAELQGDEVGSQGLTFVPKQVEPGRYAFAVGTAGSGTLVLQTVLPALIDAAGPSEITLEGGTHNPWAPPYDFLAQAYFPLVRQMGVGLTAALERHGFYPAGGGRFSVGVVPPVGGLKGLTLTTRGEVLHRSFTAVVANLARDIAQRELDAAAQRLNWPDDCFHVYEANDSLGPGNIVMIELHCEHARELFTGFGRQGARAERVASEAVDQAHAYLAADVPVGPYLADQLILPLSIAAWRHGAASRFRTLRLTRHSTTHIEIVQRFLDVAVRVEEEGGVVEVAIG
ncbi:RNA 3'-terminal phosphate cyclase [Pirellulimonas nuda]|uniref:RNA 3'-terminal phosphate cyclase n=1 Tax=Pirellulimonas nuda TaxID=2528009 RepID=A0A518DAM0_9BACT|nr:RNA 3'-terminal phosphate cyclase [Pirellulimonas nuda]QDU88531.1 RNA 3'-terminal phosphate cyclase [Pirellulimonas nuda]